jgi:two-component system NtrC family sensor kinase
VQSSQASPYDRIRRQMFLVLLCFGLVPLLAMGVAGFVANREAAETRTRNVLEAMVKNRKATIELFLEQTMRQIELVAGSHTIDQLSDQEYLESLLDQMRHDRGAIVDLGLIADDGRHVAYAGPYKLQGLNYADQSWFQQVMVHGRYESDVFLGFRKFPHMVMAVKRHEKNADWILRATIDTDILSDLVREGGLESGADVFILNRSGEYQTRYSDQHRLMERADVGSIPPHSGVRITEPSSGRRRELLATDWLQGDSWVLVARQPLPGWFPTMHVHPAVMWLLIAGLIAVPLLSYIIARHRLRQFRSLEAERSALFESVAQSQKMAAVGRLAAGVAHEINNPLAIIQAQVGLLADVVNETPELPNAREFKERIAKIEAQVDRGRKITHRLLGFSRRVGPGLERVDVIAALDETVNLLERELESVRIRIVRDYDADVPLIRGNLAQMQSLSGSLTAAPASPAETCPRFSSRSSPRRGLTRIMRGSGSPSRRRSCVRSAGGSA